MKARDGERKRRRENVRSAQSRRSTDDEKRIAKAEGCREEDAFCAVSVTLLIPRYSIA